ncbi:MAG: autotransporter-associated beta strand repeat-containing protein [Luteolibacter sp.]
MKPKYHPLNQLGLIVVTAAAFSAFSSQSAQGAAQTWDGGAGTSNWDDAINWTTDALPTAGAATINTSTGFFPIITATPSFTPTDIVLGAGGATTGRVDQRGGTVTTGVNNWVYIQNGSTGNSVYNLADTSVTGQSNLTTFGQGSGSLTIGSTSTTSGRLLLGNGGTGMGTLNINTTGTLTTKDTTIGILAGTNGGDATINLDSGTVNTGIVWVGDNSAASQGVINIAGGAFNATNLYLGRNSGQGTMNVSGGTVALTGGNTWIGFGLTATSTGALNVSGGSFSAVGEVRLGAANVNGSSAANGNFNVSGGTATVGSLTLARNNNSVASTANGITTVSGTGTLNITGSGGASTLVGWQGTGATGTLNVTGGALNFGTTATAQIEVGAIGGAIGTVNVSGGTMGVQRSSNIRFSTNATQTASNSLNISGTGALTFYSDAGTTVGGTGNIDMMTTAATSTNTVNLNGGTLTANQIKSTNSTGSRIFNFNGGVLKAASASATFLDLNQTGTHRANVRDGGAIIHTNGFNVTVAEALLHTNIGGDHATDGGLTKQGGGILTLSGTNTYNGTTTISSGTLKLASTGSIANSSTIINNATFDVSAVTAYTVGATQTLAGSGTVIGNTTVAGTLAIGNSPGSMTFNNDLTLTGVATMELGGSTTAGTDYDYGNVLGTLTYGGALNIISYNGYSLAQVAAYNLFDGGTITGDFSSVSVGGLGLSYFSGTDSWSGTTGSMTYTFTESTGVLTAVPEPGAALLGGLGMLALLRRRRS